MITCICIREAFYRTTRIDPANDVAKTGHSKVRMSVYTMWYKHEDERNTRSGRILDTV
jgi:hypothetical protein